MNTLIQECMNSIDKIATDEYEAEIQESFTLLDVYAKAVDILRYSETSDLTHFRSFMEYAEPKVIQESDDDELWTYKFRHDKKDGSGKEHLFWSLLFAIPRLFAAIFTFIGKGLNKLFSSESSTTKSAKDAGKAIADETPEEDLDKILEATNDTIGKALAEVQGKMFKNMKDNAFACTMLNKEAFDASNFKAMRAGTYENVFYIMPPFVISEYVDELKKYSSEVIGKFTYEITEELEKALSDADAIFAFYKKLADEAAKTLKEMLAASDIKLSKAETVRKIQQTSARAWVSSVEGYDPEKAKITPRDFYKSLNELHKITNFIVDSTKKCKTELEATRNHVASSGVTIPREVEKLLTSIISDTQRYNESMMARTTMIFDIPMNYAAGVQSVRKNRRTFFQLLGISKTNNVDPEDESLQRTRQTLDREMNVNESAIPNSRNSFYQDDNISGIAY